MSDFEGIYFNDPSTVDPATLTTLCILYDKLVFTCAYEQKRQLDYLKRMASHRGHEEWKEKAIGFESFLKGPLEVLGNEGIIKLISADSIPHDLRKDVFTTSSMLDPLVIKSFGERHPSYDEKKRRVVNRITIKIDDSARASLALTLAKRHRAPLVGPMPDSSPSMISDPEAFANMLIHKLSESTLRKLALPAFNELPLDTILRIRDKFGAELRDFRAAMRSLTWRFYNETSRANEPQKLDFEVDFFVSTELRGALERLENRFDKDRHLCRKRKIRFTAKVLACCASIVTAKSKVNGIIKAGKEILDIANNLDKDKPPRDPIVGFLHDLKQDVDTSN